MALIGQAVSEEKIFEIVDRRTTDHGHPISSPCEPNGSGELIRANNTSEVYCTQVITNKMLTGRQVDRLTGRHIDRLTVERSTEVKELRMRAKHGQS